MREALSYQLGTVSESANKKTTCLKSSVKFSVQMVQFR